MTFYQHKNGVVFRKVDRPDLPRLLDLKNESWFGTVQTACLNLQDQEEWFKRISGDRSSLYFMMGAQRGLLLEDVGIFGLTGIDPLNRCCDFSHSIFLEERGKGLGALTLRAGIDMAFEMFNLQRIETWILANNAAEISVVKKVGFTEEGCKRSAVYKCGEWLDCKLFGLLRREWDTNIEVQSLRMQPVPGTTHINGVCNTNYQPRNGASKLTGTSPGPSGP